MTDRIAQMDQLQAAFRSWAECLHLAQQEIHRQGMSEEASWKAAQEWMCLIIASIGVRNA